jgi:hypothetical protein
VNRYSVKTYNINQNRLYKFYYLFSFDLWTFYLTKKKFLWRCDNLFWNFFNFTRIFNELQHNFQVWLGFINVPKSISYKDFLFILITQGKKNWWYLITLICRIIREIKTYDLWVLFLFLLVTAQYLFALNLYIFFS